MIGRFHVQSNQPVKLTMELRSGSSDIEMPQFQLEKLTEKR